MVTRGLAAVVILSYDFGYDLHDVGFVSIRGSPKIGGVLLLIFLQTIQQGRPQANDPPGWEDMSSEYTGIIGVGTSPEGGAQFEAWERLLESVCCFFFF